MNTCSFVIFCCFVLLASCQSIEFEGIATATVTYSGELLNCTLPANCTNGTIFFRSYDCSDSESWNSGTGFFMDPVPAGKQVANINVTLYGNYGCSPVETSQFLASINTILIGSVPAISDVPASCSCGNCGFPMFIQGPTGMSSYTKYNSNAENVLRIWGSSTTNICLSNATISIGYTVADPVVQEIRPFGTPVNTPIDIIIVGEFVNIYSYYCVFDNTTIVNATYVDVSTLNCTAPLQSQAVTQTLDIIFENTTIFTTQFTYYVNPVITSFSPTNGSSLGDVDVYLYGTGFFNSSDIICMFAHMPMRATYINYTTIVCNDVTDYWYESPRSVNVSFSENSRDFVEAAGTYAFLGLIPPPASSPSIQPTPSIEPTSSPGRTLTIENQPTDNNYYLWTAVGGIAVIIVVLSVGLFIAVKRSKYQEIVSDYKSINEREDDFMTQSTPFLNESNLIPMRELKKLKQIEKGSFGTIYKATWHGTKIAVKKLSSTMSSQLLKEFYEEAALMRELRHPNILQYLGIAHSGNEICICMEYMPLGSLYRILHKPKSSFSKKKVKSICLDCARGMNYLHQQSPPIIHRDLKSHNLLVDKFWNVKVCDFGLSRMIAQNQTMTACGTPSWTAPEVLRNERYTTKADVYSFGVVVWEMFARADPFPGMPPFQIVFAVGTQNLRPRIDPTWPDAWVFLIKSCWCEQPDSRPTFAELIPLLEQMENPV